MNDRRGKPVHVVKEDVVSLNGNRVPCDDIQRSINTDLNLRAKFVANPANAHIIDGLHPRCGCQGASNLIDEFRINCVHEPVIDVARGVLQDEKDGEGNEQTDDRVGQLPTGRNPQSSN